MNEAPVTAAPARRVASVPAGHPYVAGLAPEQGPSRVRRLADPQPDGAPAGRWWPPVMLDGAWLRRNADAFDLLHVHFGTESSSDEELADVVAALREVGRPLVYTVHDLRNPQLTDQAPHERHLDLLVAQADALITLTPGAAAEIRRRWGREATVITHPNIWPLTVEPPVGDAGDRVRVGMSLRDLRPNIDAVRAVTTLLAAAALARREGETVEVRIDVNENVRDAVARDRVAELVAAAPGASLVEHERLSDADLAGSLADLDVSVLPYGFGTHSGWVELCWDLGVRVAGPSVGYFAEQHPEPAFFSVFEPGDAAALAGALVASGPRPGSAARRDLQRVRRDARREERAAIAAATDDVYDRALAAVVQA